MKIATKFLGEVEIVERDILTFEHGLLGLEEEREFVLLPIDADLPLALLQSVQNVEIGFVVAYPFAFKQDYSFDISEEDRAQLQIEKEEDVLTYAIVTMKETFKDSTINLLAPVILNVSKKRGKQIVLQDNKAFPLRYPMLTLEGSGK
ncbi:MAG: flagellar assembly protein FliW [Lysinibacillus fusiformis]|uniref:flagellar assembly protein FliW n=1 Tax=Lysinibacillus fusiformis TaxID=28031 RepID=UPI0012461CC3|nr:flagellar assembly protein FliW [Lysinibacillus fusiformis]KAB0442231.1 flagellar assembly protein FliW [Lysinibacillus fusiformis]MCE4046478.1 flagellar assembly protein FliW [Lysinibacillus fusiformis]MCT6817607.1 flagellar assembly protein FliW [Lysinibacillus fusiformis]MCT6928932.1 flagellar assembly protein FliW [Lysinibacillus fusiformis]MCT6932956.1 flagellar assembly protein FliW [Lysinibacillus fusiformis]